MRLWLSIATLLSLAAGGTAQGRSRFVRNGSFSKKGAAFTFTQQHVAKLRSQGWECPERAGWPMWWTGHGSNVRLACLAKGGKDNTAFVRFSGKQGLFW